ncbi:SprT family protein [Enterococcus sp. BWT-B8]|uniref:SprT family protein n=1 Tax=Enterococcus sp. BWT-B8 TaxID=2885157 RepID=UPI001E423B5C|nr:SprT family protein [Enterococcus sp. BWT-B8]MCB5951054.1 SprT family protein [Enterococcus sp. BWT-B8]
MEKVRISKMIETDEQLQEAVEQLSWSCFNKPFIHKAYFNSRLRTSGGRYHLSTHNIDFNPRVAAKYGAEELIGVIKHELCHYHLHLAGKGYQHKDRDFKDHLKLIGGSRYVRPLTDEVSAIYEYQCSDCQTKISRKRRVNINRYVCGKCHGKLKLIER